LAQACVDAARARADQALGIVLTHARDATGAERAFLVEADPTPQRPRVVAASIRDVSRASAFSRSVAIRALRGERQIFWPDLRRDDSGADAASVRALELRSVLASPIPSNDGPSSALVLDSRNPMVLGGSPGESLVRGFAAVLGLLRRGVPPPGPTGDDAHEIIGRTPSVLGMLRDVDALAAVPLPALILGESGTGKELIARRLHARGPRASKPFVAVNCAAIPESLLEREMFGAVRGAFTGADRDYSGLLRRADGGTVFLDEIGDMPLALQAKLLRVLQERSVRPVGALEESPIDIRVVSATHRDLARLVAAGRFRADLRFRLEVLVVRVPPLRERRDDLGLLANRLLGRLADRCRLPSPRIDGASFARLSAYSWPGNVRELESVLARALVRSRGGVIHAHDLDFGADESAGLPPMPDDAASLERAMIESALTESRGNVTAAAENMGMTRQTLYRKMRVLGVRPGVEVEAEGMG
jgi:transcriptional regulator with AAA-type ATPase domain